MWPFSKIEELKLLNNSKQKRIESLIADVKQLQSNFDSLDIDKKIYEDNVEDEIERQVAMRIAQDTKNLRILIEEQHQEFQDTVIRLKSENIELKKIITDIEHGK